MLRTKVLSLSGLALTLSSLLLGSHGLGYERAVLMMQAGALALILALFFRLWGTNDASNRLDGAGPLHALYDLEDG
jgi:formate hydrogenlyase subunit 4